MAVSSKHILSQGPMLRALGETALNALLARRRGDAGSVRPETPGPEYREVLGPRNPSLVTDFLRHVGADPSAYRGKLPPSLQPQWAFAPAARTLRGVSYPLARAMNYGCRLEIHHAIPADAELTVTARLEDVDDDGRRAILHQRVATSTREHSDALVAHYYVYVPLAAAKPSPRTNGGATSSKPKARVPDDAREIARWKLGADAGLSFAKLTGDFNPVHWVPAYARAFGFKNTILHGFGTMARAMEGVVKSVFAGDTTALAGFDARFVRPLVLPARVGLYVTRDDKVFVGDAPGGPAYLEGSFARRGDSRAARGSNE